MEPGYVSTFLTAVNMWVYDQRVAVPNCQREQEVIDYYSLSLVFFLNQNRQADLPCFVCVHCIIIKARKHYTFFLPRYLLTFWTTDFLYIPFPSSPNNPTRTESKRKSCFSRSHPTTLASIHFCFQLCPSMGSSPPRQYFGRQRSLHDILGGGIVADVILWRRRNVTISILFGTVAAWMIFQFSGYTLLSFVSNVLLLLLSILFVWAKAAGLLNRPPPPIPKLQLSEAVIKTAADFVYSHANMVLSATYKIALGKDTSLFYRVAGCLWLISFIGGVTDFLTLGYTGVVAVLTIPVLYEKYEDHVERYVNMACLELWHLHESYTKHLNKFKNWISEKKEKLS